MSSTRTTRTRARPSGGSSTEGRENPFFRDVASVFTIHNLPYAAQGAGRFLGDYKLRRNAALDALPPSYRDSLMALGILGADFLSTVSPTYAREILTPEGGHGLDGVLRLRADRLSGILNGIDFESWDPSADPDIAVAVRRLDARPPRRRTRRRSRTRPGSSRTRGCRCSRSSRASSRRRGSTSPPRPCGAGSSAAGSSCCSGPATRRLEHEYAEFEMRYPRRASVRLRFDARYARRIYAGADALLIPSRYEPCGLTQMIAHALRLRPGRPPDGRARRHGDRRRRPRRDRIDVRRIPSLGALGRPRTRIQGVRSARPNGLELQKNGMGRDFSWSRSAKEYVALYERARAARPPG